METRSKPKQTNARCSRRTDVQTFVDEDPYPELCSVVLDRTLTNTEEFYGSRSSLFAALLIAAYKYHRAAGSGTTATNFGKRLRQFVLNQFRYSTVRRTLSR